MTDITPAPIVPQPIQVMSMAEITDIEKKLRENRAAVLRKEAPPHDITKEQIRAALTGIKMQRGTMNASASSASGTKSKKSAPIQINLDDM